MSDPVILAVISMLFELAKAAAASGKPTTWTDVDTSLIRLRKAVADNAALDPREG